MRTVAEIVEGFKARDKIAFVNKTGYRTFTISYMELHGRILKAARMLEKTGLCKGDKILLWGYNGPDWGILFLAAAVRGIVVVPIDYMALPGYVSKIQSIVKAKLIAHSEYKLVPKLGIKEIIIEHLEKLTEGTPEDGGMGEVNEDGILEIVFTSGTTGHPKGVMLTHKNVMSNLSSIKQCIKINENQTFLSLLPMSHMLEQTPGFLAPLSTGCTIVYVRSLRPELIFKALSNESITNIIAVPRLLKLFSDSITREIEKRRAAAIIYKLACNLPLNARKCLFLPIRRKFGRRFQYFVSGGAPLSEELQSFWERMGFVIVQGYGLTECSPVLSCNTPEEQKQGSVGRPLPGVTIKVGNEGEILAQGDNVTKGYYLDSRKTKELFENGWMRTGDVGYFDSEGRLFLKGRKKDVIVTSGGEKVHPEDVEEALLELREVKEACVLGIPDNEGGEEVHAELILRTKANARVLVETANKELNQYQQIMSYALWHNEDFPRTTTMKVKKADVLQAILRRKEQVKTNGKMEIPKLFEVISRIEGVKASAIKPEAKLSLDLKLTSVNRVELVSMHEQAFNVDISEEQITGETTVRDLEQIVKCREKAIRKKIFRKWTLLPPIMALRTVYNSLVTDSFIRLLCRTKTMGTENLKGLKGPAIFVANHVGYLDVPNILLALPMNIRRKMAVAAFQEYFFPEKANILRRLLLKFYYNYSTILVNIFPFPKLKGYKRNIEYAGELLDKKWNILFFPEGEHTKTGKMQPFKMGIGWLVKEMRVPIVPIRHFGLEKVLARNDKFPRPGKVIVKIGKPIMLDYTKSIPQITAEVQKLVEKL